MIRDLTDIKRPPETVRKGSPSTYYRYPAIKKPEWRWQVPLYFFTAGLASGAYVIATLADLFGSAEDRSVSRVGRYLALGSMIVSPILLTMDLGRPERFSNMLRILKTRSPMSTGAWGLTTFGLFTGIAVVRQMIEDGVFGPRSVVAKMFTWVPLRVTGVLGTAAAFFVGSYTGVLLSFTNVPLWAKNRLFQQPLFSISAMSSGLAGIKLALGIRGNGSPRSEAWMGQAETASALGEMGLLGGAIVSLGPQARPLFRQPYALPFWGGAVGLGMIFPTLLRLVMGRGNGRMSRVRDVVTGLSTLAGGLIFRWITVRAGLASADDPSAYFDMTKDGSRTGM